MRTVVRKVGNSRGIIVPSAIMRAWGVEAGDELQLSFDGARLIVSPVVEDEEEFKALLEEILEEDERTLRALASR